jgi:hypothetical protein
MRFFFPIFVDAEQLGEERLQWSIPSHTPAGDDVGAWPWAKIMAAHVAVLMMRWRTWRRAPSALLSARVAALHARSAPALRKSVRASRSDLIAPVIAALSPPVAGLMRRMVNNPLAA